MRGWIKLLSCLKSITKKVISELYIYRFLCYNQYMSDCENLDFRDPIEREIILENCRAEQQEILEAKKKRNKTYLKGR